MPSTRALPNGALDFCRDLIHVDGLHRHGRPCAPPHLRDSSRGEVPAEAVRESWRGDSSMRSVAIMVIAVAAFLVPTRSVYANPISPGASATETVGQALCRLIESSARARGLPISFLTRLIWQESSFRATAVSPVGAQGIAQFMPGTAQERGLLDPFDPEQAIPAAASLLHDLSLRFGNLGLAAAAYNAGPNRVSAWLERRGGLPAETRDYVVRITGRSAEDWAADARDEFSSSHRFHHNLRILSSARSESAPFAARGYG